MPSLSGRSRSLAASRARPRWCCSARESGDPSRPAFEITETAAIENIDTATGLARRLSTPGCEIVLDDFGSGFPSFYYLKHLSFAVIKIDATSSSTSPPAGSTR
jgi:EAL domain-containing protein (putative c-di-GMP-specific phosphodiesterase class I)